MKHHEPTGKPKAWSRSNMESSEKRTRHGNVAGAKRHLLGIHIAQGDADPAAHARLQARSTRHEEYWVFGSVNLIRGQLPDLARRSSTEYGLHTALGEFGNPIPHPGCVNRWNGNPIRPWANVLAHDLIAAPRESVNRSGPDRSPQSVLGYAYSLCVSWSEGGVSELHGKGIHRDEDFWPGHASRLTKPGRRDHSDFDGCGKRPAETARNLRPAIETSYAREVLRSRRRLTGPARRG